MPRRNGSRALGGSVSDFRERASVLRDDAVGLGMAGKRLAQDAVHRAGDSARHYYEEGRTRVIDFERSLEDYVREYPIRSVLIAFGAGYIIGRLWR